MAWSSKWTPDPLLALLEIVTPVFLLIAAGYAATRSGVFKSSAVDGLMSFTQNFAIPVLLFRAISTLDLRQAFDTGLLLSFYIGAAICFFLGIFGARRIFGRRPGVAVAVGFGALYSNSVLLGLPIMERAYGADALAPNYAIVAVHAPFAFLLGITVMEFARADGRGFVGTARVIAGSMFRNALMIGISLGFVVNIGEIALPAALTASVDMLTNAAIPAALFGLGGVLTRYRMRTSLGEAAMTSVLSLIIHPAIVLFLATQVFNLSPEFTRSAVITAAMAPGVNTFIFATMYNRAQNAAATTVLMATALSVLSVSVWLTILG